MWTRATTSGAMAALLQSLLGTCFVVGCHPHSTTPLAVSKAPPTSSSSAAALPVQSPGSLVAPPSPCLTGSVPLQAGDVGAEVGSGAVGGVVSWLGKLNEDDWIDVIVLFPEGCSGYGECEHSVYLGCGGDRFAPVYGPEYSVTLKPDPGAPQRPIPLRELRRKDNFEEPGADGRNVPRPNRAGRGSYKGTLAAGFDLVWSVAKRVYSCCESSPG
ncbi:MAG: hypothetical protein K0R38_7042 [Polyangiaceae bacterium]|jgi:hypothetical protein|nr:hypothetical protein [Polyangiaceae bacterium]